jgi:hypothetical protein
MTRLATDPDTTQLSNVQQIALNPGVSTRLLDVPRWKRRMTRAFNAFALAGVMSDPIVYAHYLQIESESSTV